MKYLLFFYKHLQEFDQADTMHPSRSQTKYGLPSTGLTNFSVKLFNFIHIITIEVNANLLLFFHFLTKEVFGTPLNLTLM
jgi:hypothetical protein